MYSEPLMHDVPPHEGPIESNFNLIQNQHAVGHALDSF